MLATTKPFVRVGYGALMLRYLRELVRAKSEVRGIGVDKFFIEHARRVQAWHQHLELPDGCGGTMHVSGCRRCKTANVLTLPYERVVFRGSVLGAKHGMLRWRLPMCTKCDTEQPPLDLVSPILVFHGKRKDGFVDFPDDLMHLYAAHLEPLPTA